MSDLTDMQARRGRCTPEVRRRAILKAATEVFLERGYAGASVDAVVDRAGGSKASVYQMFGNKEGLLSALVGEASDLLVGSVEALPLEQKLADSLTAYGERFLTLILEPTRLALYRLVVGESGRLPALGDTFYRNGPESMTRRLADFLRAHAQRGAIAAPDPDRLANYFIGAIRGDLHFRALFNPTRTPTPKEISRHVAFVVTTFLRDLERAGG